MQHEKRFSLDLADVKCLRKYFECYVLADHGMESLLSDEEERILSEIPKKIHSALDDGGFDLEKGVRVYVVSQTVKDTTLDYASSSNIKEKMKIHLKTLCEHPAYQNQDAVLPDTNMIIQAYFRAGLDESKLCSAQEIHDFLINSAKVDFELQRLLESSPEEFKCEISIIPWDDIPLSSYYRGFIGRNGKFTGFCQYFNFMYFPELLPHLNTLKKHVQRYFDAFVDEHKAEFTKNPCLFDFSITGFETPENLSISILRIVSFDEDEMSDILSGELFEEQDKTTLLDGTAADGLQMRIQTTYVSNDTLVQYISPNVEFFMDEVVYEFHNNAPVALNLVGMPSWCSLL